MFEGHSRYEVKFQRNNDLINYFVQIFVTFFPFGLNFIVFLFSCFIYLFIYLFILPIEVYVTGQVVISH